MITRPIYFYFVLFFDGIIINFYIILYLQSVRYSNMLELNSLIFPSSHSILPPSISHNLLFIPKSTSCSHDIAQKSLPSTARSSHKLKLSVKQTKKSSSIPCLYLQGPFLPDKLIIYFHGNAEDLASSYEMIKIINYSTGRSVLSVEYPGYSIYENKKSSQKTIESDADDVLKQMIKRGFELKNITVMGRSIGSGVGVYLASKYEIGHLVLISPFLSICEVVKDLYCEFFSWLLKDKFNNRERIRKVRCPCLIVHGLKDEIIPYRHSVELSSEMGGMCVLKLVRQMSHSNFDLDKDLLWHVNQFYGNMN